MTYYWLALAICTTGFVYAWWSERRGRVGRWADQFVAALRRERDMSVPDFEAPRDIGRGRPAGLPQNSGRIR